MKRWLQKWGPIVLIGILVYLAHERRPLLETFQERLYFDATGVEADAAVLNDAAWETLELRDFYVITAVQDSEKNTLVAFGFGNYIKVIDDEWVQKAFRLEPPQR